MSITSRAWRGVSAGPKETNLISLEGAGFESLVGGEAVIKFYIRFYVSGCQPGPACCEAATLDYKFECPV